MIVAEGVKKSFSDLVVLDGFDLSVPKGESYAIIGKSGSGKSVFLKLVVRLLEIDSGSLRVAGIEVKDAGREAMKGLRMKIGMVFQGAALFDSLTVGENIAFGLSEHFGTAATAKEEIAAELLRDVGLSPDVVSKKPSELSGGMKKRVGLARALAMEPELILYDEPTTGLDPITADAINDLIIETREKHGATSIVVTHDMASAYKVANRLAMLYKGRIIATGTGEEFRETEDPFVRQFVRGEAQGPISILE